MKRQLRTMGLAAALLLGVSAGAQTPVGTLVGNFTLTDINGNTHNLYDYLDAGKMVVIDVSATWCGPCWAYHGTHALNDFYTAHGPSGADDAMVFFIEGDVSTTNADLHGTGSNTQGDWVTGENMPIIDLTSAASFENTGMDIAYFPVMYVICPNRTILQSGVAGAIGTLSNLNSYVGDCATAVSGNNAAINQYSGTIEAPCGQPATAKVILQNMGTTDLTACTITGTVGSSTLGPINWTGNLSTYEYEEVNLGSFTLSGPATMNITITTTDGQMSDNSVSVAVSNNEVPMHDVTIQIVTDAYGSETTWTLKNSGGTTVASGGPYNDLSSVGTTTQTPVNLTLPNDCYTLKVNDAYGDGMNSGYGTGSFTVSYGGSTVVLTGGEFASSTSRKFSINGDDLGFEDQTIVSGVSVYPNPVSELATINVQLSQPADITVSVINGLGQIVESKQVNGGITGSNLIDVDFAGLDKGIYFVNVTIGDQVIVTKVVK